MFNLLISAGCGAGSGAGCYDWPVIKQIIIGFSWFIDVLYNFLDSIGLANIGLVIILFTLIIKCILLPLTINQQKFTKLTAIMQPEISAIQAKYKGRRDNYSMQAMQEETKAVYAKYGVSQTGGCLQTLIQMPIIIALYGALRQMPLVIDKLNEPLVNIASIINNAPAAVQDAVKTISVGLTPGSLDTQITTLYTLTLQQRQQLMDLFNGANLDVISTGYKEMVSVNSIFGIDLSQTPWNLMLAGGIGILAILLPLIAGASQWLSFKLGQTAKSARDPSAAPDPMGGASKSMGFIMPLFSVVFCFTLNAGLGLYWAFSSLFQVILQIFINRHYRKIDMDEFVKKNMEKAEAKAKRKREKKGVKGSTISAAANTNTKNMGSSGSSSIKDIANMNVGKSERIDVPVNPNSLAAKAGSVQKYNEEHESDDVTTKTGRKKYKK